MKRALEILGLFTMAAAIFALTELGFTLRQSRLTFAQAGKDEVQLATQFSKLGKHADEVLTQFDEEVPLEKQRVHDEFTLVKKTTAGINDLVKHTDIALNGGELYLGAPKIEGALPAATAALDRTASLADASAASMRAAALAISDTQKRLQPILEDSATASNSLATQLPPLLSHMNDAAASTAVATEQIAQASTDVHGVTKDAKDVADKIHDDFMHPTHRIWHYFLTVLGIASDAGNASKL